MDNWCMQKLCWRPLIQSFYPAWWDKPWPGNHNQLPSVQLPKLQAVATGHSHLQRSHSVVWCFLGLGNPERAIQGTEWFTQHWDCCLQHLPVFHPGGQPWVCNDWFFNQELVHRFCHSFLQYYSTLPGLRTKGGSTVCSLFPQSGRFSDV